jgi:hypothetical protein
MPQTQEFNFHFYFKTLTRVLGEPRKFFSELPNEVNWNQSLGFLGISSLFFAAASVIGAIVVSPNPLLMGLIFFINAIGMTFISAGLGYIVMVMSMGKRMSFGKFFSVYAFSSGVTLLASWVPFFTFLTEPWKWWLIGTGMTRGFEFKLSQTLMVIGISVGVIILFFWSFLQMTSPHV